MIIEALQTIRLAEFPSVIFLEVTTDDGLVGTSDTYYTTSAVEAVVHDYLAPRVLGQPVEIERIWFDIFERGFARWGGVGAELRALSALDSCLWDIQGQAAGLPVYQLLGGPVSDSVPTYNTCAGPRYGLPGASRLGDGPGDLEDLWAQNNDPAGLAEELVAEGYAGMKVWPFDRFSLDGDGHHISGGQLAEGVAVLEAIRNAVGDRIEIMLEGHGYWDLHAAKRIAAAVEDLRPAWLEDLVLAHDIGALAELKASTRTPVVASEYLVTKHQYRNLLEHRAADLVMIDPTWAGGITETRKVSVLAEAFGLPVAMHDCTGPFTLLAGVHVALSAPNVIWQESVRAFVRTWYNDLLTGDIDITGGRIRPPAGPGIGASLQPDVIDRPGTVVRRSSVDDG